MHSICSTCFECVPLCPSSQAYGITASIFRRQSLQARDLALRWMCSRRTHSHRSFDITCAELPEVGKMQDYPGLSPFFADRNSVSFSKSLHLPDANAFDCKKNFTENLRVFAPRCRFTLNL